MPNIRPIREANKWLDEHTEVLNEIADRIKPEVVRSIRELLLNQADEDDFGFPFSEFVKQKDWLQLSIRAVFHNLAEPELQKRVQEAVPDLKEEQLIYLDLQKRVADYFIRLEIDDYFETTGKTLEDFLKENGG